MSFVDKVAIITGAGQGIGRAIAIELAKAGAIIVIVDINPRGGEETATMIISSGGKAFFAQGDCSKGNEVKQISEAVRKRYGGINFLVNNAGISPKGPEGKRLRIQDISEEEWERVFNLNLKGVFNWCKWVLPVMIEQGFGKVVNISSIAGITGGYPGPSGAHYAASKAGVICLTKTLAREAAPFKINVNTVAPGRVDTEMSDQTDREVNEATKKQIPLGRFARPEEIAKGVLYFLSDAADFITGETLIIDGGRVMD
jgi:NAD(P)-dependent dehydrogenase (short-subunit alcohol dehydrogenase family)